MIPLLDLQAQYRSIKPEIDAAIASVLDSGRFVLGEPVAEFERNFAGYCEAKEAVAVNSGTSALHLALLAAGIGPGDEVITVPFTFIATISAILYSGARPVLVDIDPQTYCMDVTAVERAITPRTRAVMPVHLYGHPAEMDSLAALARRHNLVLIEDAAQAHGAEYHGRRVGAIGDIGCFSFYPGKNLGAYGEGGALVTNNPEYAAKARLLRNWGEAGKYQHVLQGYNYRMEAIQGAILDVKLRHLPRWTEARRALAARYTKLLKETGLTLPFEQPGCCHVFHQYTLRVPIREKLRAALDAEGIQSGVHYPIPSHLQPAFASLGYKVGDFPVSEKAAQEVLSLPLFPEMTEQQIGSVASVVATSVAASLSK
ncbi:MAG: DegT/DnrJ/EryC1/StrS family aminotransferase [Candidatus Korobacteraceae bacterium]